MGILSHYCSSGKEYLLFRTLKCHMKYQLSLERQNVLVQYQRKGYFSDVENLVAHDCTASGALHFFKGHDVVLSMLKDLSYTFRRTQQNPRMISRRKYW